MKIRWKLLILCILIPIIVGGLAGLISQSGMDRFNAVVTKPALSPPDFLFPIVWNILYILMGIASYIILTNKDESKSIKGAMILYGAQLLANFLWTLIFFNLDMYMFSFVWLVFLWILILLTIISFCRISKVAAILLVPYILWVTFAGYLNFSIYLLN